MKFIGPLQSYLGLFESIIHENDTFTSFIHIPLQNRLNLSGQGKNINSDHVDRFLEEDTFVASDSRNSFSKKRSLMLDLLC